MATFAIALLIAMAQTVDWQTAAGGKMAFEVASVKLDTGEFRPPKFPLDNGNAYTPVSQFSADFPLITYIQFASKPSLPTTKASVATWWPTTTVTAR